jgi:uncharacterized membrane protein YgdD (TMEM256/DUF423 family)
MFLVRWAAGLLFLGVAIGAFGAHGIRPYVSADSYQAFHTGVEYLFYHAFAILAVGIMLHCQLIAPAASKKIALTFTCGILLFSGSLFLLSTRAISQWPISFLGPVTPLGGLLFLAGWAQLFFAVKTKSN